MGDDAVGIVGAVGSVIAAGFAYLAWAATRAREPFRLSPTADKIVVLTRTGLLRAELINVAVAHHWSVHSTDDRAKIAGRRLKQYEFVVLDMDPAPQQVGDPDLVGSRIIGETLRVTWKRWPTKRVRWWTAPILATPRQ